MPVLIHRNFTQYSLPSNRHHPSELPPYQSQSSVDLSLWMLKSFTPTSDLNFERIPFPQNTSICSQTRGPLTLMIYSGTPDRSTFQTPEVFDSVFSNTHTTIPLQDISVRQRHYIKFGCITTGPDFRSLSKTTANCVPSVPMPNLCATNLTDSSTASDSGKALEFHLHGFHREAPSTFWLHLDSSHC